MKTKLIPQYEFLLSKEAFNLALQATQDGDKVAAAAVQVAADKAASEALQTVHPLIGGDK